MTQGSFVRRRPRDHDGSSTAELAVFDATERLLADTSLQDLTVAQILETAGLSRANFYHYFANKYDVLVALLGRVFDESYGTDAPWYTDPGRDRARRMGSSLEQTLEMWSEHGAVICAVIEHMHSQPSVAAAWQRMFERFVSAVAEQVTFERAEGRAPDGPAAEMLGAMLVGGAERAFYVSSRGLDDRLPAIASVTSSLSAINEAAIYGGRTVRRTAKKRVPVTAEPRSGRVIPVPEPAADTETAQGILQAMRELLMSSTLAELSVASILKKAGISRASFYFYFRSKEDAFIVLFREAAADIVAGLSGVADVDRKDPSALLAQVGNWLNLDGHAGAIIKNAVHEWPRLPELRVEYLAAMTAMESTLESIIVADRGRGIAPPGPPAGEFTATVLWTIERTIAGSLAGEAHLDDLDAVTAMVGQFLYAAIYGTR
ncbi:TetR/AcrR family transcriptional regulator [Gordonia tangerina]|uniref:TetR/AcrR family transcriptional regulator n=1 Tax=Gordonia tangerina TaxID=2911060 RepID=A0ABS9DN17_9ACTN|nr:TetR/AcrR family transcriptional regulator [Gordonia tangerina]MCF3939674.1 TetR/AcrR family transcriptional regulator [Gordonia tangerina]